MSAKVSGKRLFRVWGGEMADQKKLPFFAFYPDDFTADTAHLSNEAIGLYIRLLCYLWKSEKISLTKIQAFAKRSLSDCSSEIELILELLSYDGESYFSSRLEKERAKALDKSMINKANAREGGLKTQQKRREQSQANAQANASNSASERLTDAQANDQAELKRSRRDRDIDKDNKNPPLPPLRGTEGQNLYPDQENFLRYCQVHGGHFGLTEAEWIDIFREFEFSGWTTVGADAPVKITNWKMSATRRAKALSDKKKASQQNTTPAYVEKAKPIYVA